jgi:hypothetical protein
MSSSLSDNEFDADDRPNRWTGNPSTWQSLTEQERGLATSLDQIRNQDLSIHLYNAHALKKRALSKSQRPRDNRGQSNDTHDEEDPDGDTEDKGEGWVPPKVRTYSAGVRKSRRS